MADICKYCANEPGCAHTGGAAEDCSGFAPVFDPIVQAVKTYGAEAQKWVLIGEIGELLDAVADHRRGRCGVDHIAEEIADVMICLHQLYMIYECKGAVNRWMLKKVQRLGLNLAKKEIQKSECKDQHA